MKIIAVIPARWDSERLPQKPLKGLLGKPLIQWVYEGVSACSQVDECIVATDHEMIYEAVRQFGGQAQMTSSQCHSGTDRIWEVVKECSDVDWVLNVQGDEPLITAQHLNFFLKELFSGPEFLMGTMAQPLSSVKALHDPHIVKVLTNQRNQAIYFSRFPIPYSRKEAPRQNLKSLHHLGVYLFQKDFLGRFCNTEPSELEKAESLEQLRALDLGVPIQVIRGEFDLHGVDTPEDLVLVEQILKKRQK
ncbi:MAG: 3-deoxy-manno-octulosonate cytidylyltransferase [Bdellovibrio sp.]|nr:MAG: 3-deoxy-manno-octulosonate cytidylyltransferase [Bdellovibrio sp.]